MFRFANRSALLGWIMVALLSAGCGNGGSQADLELLNVSYDPTRELWRDVNTAFAKQYATETGKLVEIKQSHGGSGTQARSVIDGLEADVVTLAMWADTDAIRQRGLIGADWQERLPHRALPYFSTIVFVVRKGNPKGIQDWPDLIKPDVQIVTPNPKTSGNGKLSFLAAWGSVMLRGGNEDKARAFVTSLYRQVPVLDTGARGCTTTFAQKGIGDVHLTWENEAKLEVAEAKGELEIVYPKISIRAEPFVAVVDGNVDRKRTRHAAESYLKFLYTPEGQEIIAKHHYRPIDGKVLAKHADTLPELKLFTIDQIAKSWGEAEKFFGDGGTFDLIYQRK